VNTVTGTCRGQVPAPLSTPERITAQLNGWPVPVCVPHRRWSAADYVPPPLRVGGQHATSREPVVVTVTASVGLSLEDLTAVLAGWNLTYEELADDAYLRELVADTVVSSGSLWIEDQRCQLGEQTPNAEQGAYLAYCRARALAVFGHQGGER